MMFWYGGNGWAWWEAGVMWLAMIAFWGVVIWLGYYLVTSLFRDGRRGGGNGTAGDILDERLAKGEIDVEEYRRLRRELDERRAERSAR